jgi:aromatic-L-amino-acid decarboxylase
LFHCQSGLTKHDYAIDIRKNKYVQGSIQGTASEAVVVALLAAKERTLSNLRSQLKAQSNGAASDAEIEEQVRLLSTKLIAYASSQTHSCTKKATMIAGTRLRVLDANGSTHFKLTGEHVKAAMQEDVANGLIPFFVTVTIGTTSSGVVDDIPAIASANVTTTTTTSTFNSNNVTLELPKLWIHVDAAWAGSALVCPEYQPLLAGVEHCDSFDFNMHKWLLVNFDCSLLFVKDTDSLRNALSLTPVFLRNAKTDEGLVTDYKDWQLPLGRRFRSLKIWFVVRSYGLKGLREHIRKFIKHAELMQGLIESDPGLFKLVSGPNFALLTFQVLPSATCTADSAELKNVTNQLTKKVHQTINASGEIYVTHTVLDGTDVIRFVSGSPWTQDEHIRKAFEHIKEVALKVREEMGV